MDSGDQVKEKVSFKDTLNLPTTEFPIRSNPAVDDPAMIIRWQQEKLFEKSFFHNEGNTKFILHYGPPYANGNMHVGHAYTEILKDIVCKSERMRGKQVPVTPGWDCHGLPIEKKVSDENPGLTPLELKKKCREYAQGWIDIQKEELKRLGLLMHWSHPYITMNHDYESYILQAFGKFVEQGYIERKNKTVPWCASCKTVLASAEIEYSDRKDPSIYVLFPLEQTATDTLFPSLKGQTVNVIIWTTTPWTLPLNRAVLLKPDAQYQLLKINDTYALIGAPLADKLCALLNVPKVVVATIDANALLVAKAHAQHPFIENMAVPILPSQTVTIDDGTAFVHCAPGCGPEDYEIGVKNNLEIFSPVSPDGKYTAGIAPAELENMNVADGQIWVIKTLAATGRMLYKTTIKHSYPHCWRCHQGLIFRATKQWFCDLSKHDLKNRVLTSIDGIEMFPEKSKNRLTATVQGRLEWCLSRQRIWGVPIPALLCVNGDYTYTNQAFINKVADQVKKEGIEYWDRVTVTELMPQGLTCPHCASTHFIKEQDILDVWFDSGISHFAVLKHFDQLHFPADMYLEGKDQHRGWFQSSLLTAQVLENAAPMKKILTHGFTVDQQGKKMSKSLGNVVSPEQMIKELGTDGLRLWVSSIDYADDAVVSPVLLANVKEVLRKVRNTCRFLLSNLYDYDHAKDALPLDQLLMIDRYALEELHQVNEKINQMYEQYNFTGIFHALGDYCASSLSSFYLDIVKDRLYVEKANGQLRRSAQTACWYILDTMTKAMAPILSFTAEQVSDIYQKNKTASIHLQNFAQLPSVVALHGKGLDMRPLHLKGPMESGSLDTVELHAALKEYDAQWDTLKLMRSAVLKAIEELRAKAIIKHSLEARVTLYFDPKAQWYGVLQQFISLMKTTVQTEAAFFKEFLIVSQVAFAQDHQELQDTDLTGFCVKVEVAKGNKCPRCWNWDDTQHEHHLCDRCFKLLNS